MAEAVAQTVLDKISQGHLECPICCCRFEEPKILDCLHSYCLKCLKDMLSSLAPGAEKMSCPVCRRETQIPEGGLQSLPSSFFLISLADEITKQEELLGKAVSSRASCESCEGERQAVSRCLDCKENICEKCREAHQRVKHTKDHRIISTTDVDKESVPPPSLPEVFTSNCRRHTDQPLCFYCETCDTLICALCAATQHRSAEHNFISIAAATETFRKSVNNVMQKFEESKKQFASIEDSIIHAQNTLQKNAAQARSDIDEKVEAEVAKVRNKGKLLTEKVNKITQERESEYGKALTQNREQMKRAGHIVSAVSDLMRQADQCEVLDLKPKVMYNLDFLQELSCQLPHLDKAFIRVKCQGVRDTVLGEIVLQEKWQLKREFGRAGTNDGEFQWATGVACFSNGDIVVTDLGQERLSSFAPNMRYKTSVDQGGLGDQLEAPCGVAINQDDLLFVTDKKKVKVFNKELKFLREFIPAVDNAEGPSESDFKGIAVDQQRVAVADWGRKIISVHNLDGSLIASTSSNTSSYYFIALSNKDRLIFTNNEDKRLLGVDFRGNEVFNIMTLLEGEPANPIGVLCDNDGSIYVAVLGKLGQSEVQHFDPNGAFIGTVAQQLFNPFGLAFTPDGDVIVADRHSIKIFQRM